jgi:hypothetical protein
MVFTGAVEAVSPCSTAMSARPALNALSCAACLIVFAAAAD